MKYCYSLLLLLVVATTLAQTGLLPRERLFEASKDQYRITLSSDGQRVYYQRRSGAVGQLFYINVKFPTREQIIHFNGAIFDWRLCHNGGVAAVIQKDVPTLHYAAPGQLESTLLDVLRFDQARILATSPRYSNDILLSIITDAEGEESGLYKLNVATQKWQRTGDLPPYQNVFFDQELRPRAARHPNDIGGFSFYRYNGLEWMECLKLPFDESQFTGGFQNVISVHANGGVFYLTENSQTDKTVLRSISVESGESQLILADGKADILPFATMIAPDGKPEMVVSVFGDARRHFLNPDTQKDYEYTNALLEGQASYVQSSADGRKWLMRKLTGGPMTYYLYDRDSRKMTKLFNDLPELEAFPMAKRTTHSIVTRDGYELPIQVYLPLGSDADEDGIPQKPLPTIVYVHGGPWAGISHWNQWFHVRNFQMLANRGYAVINTEFRGSTGLGKHFIDLGDEQWGEKMLHDKIDIAEWAVENGIAQKDKMAIWGWSYGSYATTAALAFFPETFACGLAMYGPADLNTFSRIPFTDSELWRNRVGNPNTAEGTALLKRHSPALHIDQITKPLLLTTGAKDERIPKKQVDDFAEALHEAGKTPIYFYYPEERHDYGAAGSWISFWAIAEQFLHQHLGGQFEPVGDDLEKGDFKIIYGKDVIKSLE
jgi:acetyl esterase/lipase